MVCRFSAVFGVALLATTYAGASTCFAYENFIPLGTGYSTEVDSVPEFGTERAQINQEADIIETEIWRSKREAAEFDSRIDRFFSDAEVSGGDTTIDY